MNKDRDPIFEQLWRFVRGDLPAADFQQWVFGTPELESILGEDLHLETISTDSSDDEAVWRLQTALARYLRPRSRSDCLCIRLKDLDVVGMGFWRGPVPAFEDDPQWSDEDVFRSLDEVKARGEPYWWLSAARCRACGEGWLVGQEERHNDVFCMRRLDQEELEAIERHDRWPTDFDTYERLLRIGLEAGHTATFLDPIGSSSLDATIALLAEQRPGIAVSELAVLLGLSLETAVELARRAVEQKGVKITFDRS